MPEAYIADQFFFVFAHQGEVDGCGVPLCIMMGRHHITPIQTSEAVWGREPFCYVLDVLQAQLSGS